MTPAGRAAWRARRSARAVWMAGLALVAVAACRDAAPAVRQEPAAGAASGCGAAPDAAEPARRVVSLLPAGSEIVVALHAVDRLVARTDHDTHPALQDLPSVGGGLTPSLEWLAQLRPDLVVTWPDHGPRSLEGPLRRLGAATLPAATQSLADVRRLTCEIGRRLGRTAAADSVVRAFDAELARIARNVAGRARPTVFYVVWPDPPTTAGPGSFVDELIEIAGGRNVFADAPAPWPQVSLEEVVRRDPDVVILPVGEAGTSPARLASAPGWRELRAVREGRVVSVDHDLFHHPGPGLTAAAMRLAAVLHPENEGAVR